MSEASIDKYRNNLPHWGQSGTCVFATFRLADSMPQSKLRQWGEERGVWLAAHPKPWSEAETREYHSNFGGRLERLLDDGLGSCVLADAGNRRIVWEALLHFDGVRYRLFAFVVMPNHVHVLFQPLGGHSASSILRSWKSFTATALNKRLGRVGALWQSESWDRLVRSADHFAHVMRYIKGNPKGSGIPVYVHGEATRQDASSPYVAASHGDEASSLVAPPAVATRQDASSPCPAADGSAASHGDEASSLVAPPAAATRQDASSP